MFKSAILKHTITLILKQQRSMRMTSHVSEQSSGSSTLCVPGTTYYLYDLHDKRHYTAFHEYTTKLAKIYWKPELNANPKQIHYFGNVK